MFGASIARDGAEPFLVCLLPAAEPGGTSLPGCRHSIEHLVLVLRCDGLHGSRAVSAGAARVLVSAALAFPPANLCWHTQGPHSGQPFVTFSDAGVWSPVGL